MQPKIFLAVNDTRTLNKIKALLQRSGYAVSGEVKDGPGAVRQIHSLLPDLVVLDSELPGLSTLQILGSLQNLKIPVILLVKEWQPGILEQGREYNVLAALARPLEEFTLLPAIETAFVNFSRLKQLTEEISKLKQDLETRKVIEKAKGLLMQKLHLTEEDAYKLLRQKAMNSQLTLGQIAEAVIRNI